MRERWIIIRGRWVWVLLLLLLLFVCLFKLCSEQEEKQRSNRLIWAASVTLQQSRDKRNGSSPVPFPPPPSESMFFTLEKATLVRSGWSRGRWEWEGEPQLLNKVRFQAQMNPIRRDPKYHRWITASNPPEISENAMVLEDEEGRV